MDTLRRTQLLSAEQIDKLVRRVPKRLIDARLLARVMLQKGWLTVYQINQLLIGRGEDLVIGPYHVLDRLGEGGQSSVYKARHVESGLVVALKVVKEEMLAGSAAAEQFMQEMEAMAALDHPNVVQFYDADKSGESFYCALEYVEGTDLGKYVRLAGPLPAVEACDYIRQAALGLQHAHERNLIHRDIKPQNLYLTGEPCQRYNSTEQAVGSVVKILDWGLASLRPPRPTPQQLSQSGSKLLLGTADYLSPEQALDSDSVDIRGDIYSLGCTFYYLLTGYPPFPTGKLMHKILAHQNQEPVAIHTLRPDVTLGLARIIHRMLAKKPQDRCQTPAAIALALKPFCHPDRFMPPRLNPDHRQQFGLDPDGPAQPHPASAPIGDGCTISTFGPHNRSDTLTTLIEDYEE